MFSRASGVTLPNMISRRGRNARVFFLRLEDSGERTAVSPEQKELEQSDDNRRRETFRGHEDVENPDVEDDCAENRQGERDEASYQQQQAANYLKGTDDVNVTALKKRSQVKPDQTLRYRRHGKEMQKRVRAEHDEDQSEQDTGNDGQDFHGWFIFSREAALAQQIFAPLESTLKD